MALRDQRYVVVGVDASPEALVAAHYAAWQAELRHLDLMVVYSYAVQPLESPTGDNFYSVLTDAAQSIVDAVVAQLAVPAAVTVQTLLGRKAPLLLLQGAAKKADLVVLGQHHISWLERLTVGSVVSPLSQTTACPVIVVPKMWRLGPADHNAVVVALDGETPAKAALDFAFAEAELLGTEVLALHAMTAASSVGDLAVHERNVNELLASYRSDYPDTPVRVITVRGDADKILVESSWHAAMLVVGPPHHDGLSAWTRSVARQVLKQTECPLVIVPRPPEGDDGLLGQSAVDVLVPS